MADPTFSEAAIVELDRIQRSLDILRDNMRGADEFLLFAQQRVQETREENAPRLPGLVLHSNLPQSVGVTAGWREDRFVIQITHRGDEFETLVSPGEAIEVEIPGAEVVQ